jgi:hypothetical protein
LAAERSGRVLCLGPLHTPTAELIRDALGLARLLYSARRTDERGELCPLVAIGRELGAALDLSRFEEGSLGNRAAVDRASRALVRLAAEVAVGDSVAQLVRVARERVAELAHRGMGTDGAKRLA